MPNDWQLALEQQANLVATHGSVRDAADAVLRGAALVARPGHLPFERVECRRAMQWMIAERA